VTLLRSPVDFAYEDVTPGGVIERARVYYPARLTVGEFRRNPFVPPIAVGGRLPPGREPARLPILEIRPGEYPLVAFIHGQRSDAGFCPPDATEDYRRWVAVLHLLARCGIVVVVPDVSETLASGNENEAVPNTASAVAEVIRWMFDAWEHREVLTPPGAWPGSGWLGLAGHSWGAAACGEIVATADLPVRAVAAIAGTWTHHGSRQALAATRIPKLFITGTNDNNLLGIGLLPYDDAPASKHHAAFQGAGHWDWFPEGGASIYPCSGETDNPCVATWQAASELMLVFFYKYLFNQWFLRPYLMTSPGGRPPILDAFAHGTGCALRVRWDTVSDGVGEISLGEWTESAPW
jgi:hypothetical protein